MQANQTAFSNLIEQFGDRSDEIVPPGIRYIRTSVEEKIWLKELVFGERLDITPSLRMQMIKYGGKNYVSVIGAVVDSARVDSDVLEEIDQNAGIVTAMLSEKIVNLSRSINILEFYNSILFQHLDQGYSGHDFHELIQFIDHFATFALPDDSVLKDEGLSRIACYIFSLNHQLLILNFSDDVLELTSELSLVGSDSISYKILVGYLFSNTYKHAFLEIYRLIERLFPIGFLKDFYHSLKTEMSFLRFVASIEDDMSWKPREDDALEKIFGLCSPETKRHFDNFLATSELLRERNINKFFYSLRNSIVHFRANHEEYSLSREQWNLLLLATLYLLDEQYSLHNRVLQQAHIPSD